MEPSTPTSIVPRLALSIALWACAAVPSAGQPVLALAGYAKNLAIRSHSVVDGDAYLLDVSRIRLQGSAIGGPLHAEVWVDTELGLGSFLETAEARLADVLAPARFVDLDWRVASGDRWRLDERIYRATVAWYGEKVSVVVGRHRVSWGTGFVWTPTDVLHPLDPVAIERDEKPAVDLVQVTVPLGALSGAEAVFAPGAGAGRHRVAGRLRGHVGEYDWTLMGGRFAERWVLGGDFAGYVGDGGLRGEAALSRGSTGRWDLRAVVNGDYTFAGGWYVFVEGHFNGPGAARSSAYDPKVILEGSTTNLGRWYAATGITYLWSPLVTATLYGVQNVTDGSVMAGPGLTWSAFQNAEVTDGIYIFIGSGDSEFGAYRDAAFVSLQVFF